MSASMAGRRQKNLKLRWLKHPKTVQKRSLILQYSFAQKTSLILRTSTHSIL